MWHSISEYKHKPTIQTRYHAIKVPANKETQLNFLSGPLEENSTLEPTYVLVFEYVLRKHLCVDQTWFSPLMGLMSENYIVGKTTLKVVSYRVTKHKKSCMENQILFIPFMFDTFSFLTLDVVEMPHIFQWVMYWNVITLRSKDVVFKRIIFVTQTTLATQLVACFPSNSM